MSPELILVILLAVVFDFLNGVHDSSNIVATMIASRAFSPRSALALDGSCEFSRTLFVWRGGCHHHR